MHAPIVATATRRPHRLSVALALALHAGAAAALLAPVPPAAPPAEPATLVELVQWSPPPPVAEPLPAAPKPIAAPQPAKVAPPRPAAMRPRPAAPATAAATEPAAAEPAAVLAQGDDASAQSAAAGPGPAATAAPATGDITVPPSGDADYLANPKPAYPPLAQKRGWEGVVTLLVAVDETGTPQDVRVKASSGHSLLDRCAVEAVQRWRFTPARRGGKAVAANVEVPIRFGLEAQATG